MDIFAQIGNWNLQKAGFENDRVIRVRIIANRLTPDAEGEEILPEAFSPAVIEYFLANGVIDWQHQSMMGTSDEERSVALIGRPVSFAWENGLPVVYADLTKKNPIVERSILPHLEASNSVFGASVGGRTLQKTGVIDPKTGSAKDLVSRIFWNHLAIAGRPYVMNVGTEVSLAKAQTGQILTYRFSDMGTFAHDHALLDRGEELAKALTVGGGTDIATLTGGDALRVQSLEVGVKNLNSSVQKYLQALAIGDVGTTLEGCVRYIMSEGYSRGEAELIANQIVSAVEKIAA